MFNTDQKNITSSGFSLAQISKLANTQKSNNKMMIKNIRFIIPLRLCKKTNNPIPNETKKGNKW